MPRNRGKLEDRGKRGRLGRRAGRARWGGLGLKREGVVGHLMASLVV